MLNMTGLENAERFVNQGRNLVTEQREKVRLLKAAGRDTYDAEQELRPTFGGARMPGAHSRSVETGALHYVNDGNIAIVGVSCRLPGGIADMDGLWDALVNGRNLVGTVPSDRFDPDQFIHPDPKKPGKILYKCPGGPREHRRLRRGLLRAVPKGGKPHRPPAAAVARIGGGGSRRCGHRHD